ncbi:MAG: zinc-ribbon domain-containing protein [Geobacteraceae bacterium]|nr:zinc-ribbon domain-containing protein [Geobacteraceae bacterium]
MPTIRVSCPHCAFSRDVPGDKVPDRPVRVTCPRCKQAFEFQKPSPPPAPSEPAVAAAPRQPDSRATAPSPTPPSPPGPPPVGAPPTSAPNRPPAERPIRVPPPHRLLEVGELFAETWDAFRRRWLLLIGLLLLALAAALLPPVIVGGGMAWLGKSGVTIDGTAFILLAALAAVAAFIALFRGLAALMAAAVDDGIGFREALSRGRASWVALFWVSSLYGFIVGGASLLLIIPGIVAGVWFFAAPYMTVTGDARGMEALLKSRAIVTDRFWPVFLRLFLVWLLSIVVGMIPIAGPLLALAMAPFTILYQTILYRSLAQSAGSAAFPCASGDKARWLLLGLAGYLLVPVAIVAIFGASFVGSLLPLLKLGSAAVQGRQVITIPPPSGELPEGFPQGIGAGGASTPPAGAGPTPTIEIGPAPGPAAAGSQFRATDLSVFIYAVNAPGTIRVNGQEFEVIKSEPDMQYNINSFGEHFRPGENSIDLDVTPTPGDGRSLSPSIHMKVSQGGKVLGEWRLSDKDGWPRSVTVVIPEGLSP